MSASGFTPIQLYRTSTAAATPSAGNLADGELAINLTDEKLYFKNASGVVKLLASNSGSLGSVTSVDASGSTTGLTFTGGPITSSGTLTLGGTLVVGNGGTGANTAAGARTNLGVPANDGTGATGTWGISVTGNAGTVTNGVYTTGNQTIGGLKTFSSTILLADGGFMFDSDGARDTGINWASDGVMNVRCNGVTVGQFNSTGFTGNAANVTGTVAVANGGTGATSLTSGYLLKGNGTSAVSSSVVYDTGTNVGIGTASPGAKFQIQQDQAAYSYFDYYNVTNGGGIVWRQIVRNLADTGTTSVDFAKLISSGFVINNNDTGAANFTAFGVGGSERMRITSAGNVGIGTSAPNAKLDVVGNVVMGAALTTGTGVSTGDVQVELGANRTGDGPCYIDWHSTAGTDFESRIVRNSGANGTMDILNTGTGGINLSNFGSAAITLATGGIDRMRVTSTGNVGIGTTSPQARLHVRPTTDVNLWTTNDSTTLRTIAINDGVSAYINWRRDANQHTFETNGSERVRFSQTGNVGIGTTSPAQRIHAATTAAPTGTTQSFLRLTGDSTFGADFGGGLIQGTGPIATISTVNAGTATERMRIDGSGNVGIGSTGGDYGLTWRLIVKNDQDATTLFGVTNNSTGPNASTQISKISGGANNYVSWRLSGAAGSQYDAFEYGTGVTSVRWNLGGSERVRIDSSGNVGINESAPDYKLDVNGTFGFAPGSSVTPVDNGDVVFELTNNTTLTIKAKGSDGVVRSATITLA